MNAVTGRAVELRRGEQVALAASDFTVPSGGITAVIGPNGSGKSTLLEAVVGLHPTYGGEITVLGSDPISSRPRVSFVPQSTKVNEVLPVTVAEVVSMGRFSTLGLRRRFGREDRGAVQAAIDLLDLHHLAGRHLYELSGGQRQRVFVAQGLAQAHELLLMDEPLTALDVVSSQVMREAIRQEMATGCTIVVTTHDLDEAGSADHVVLLAGRVIAEGTPAEVLTDRNLEMAYGSSRIAADDAAHHPEGVRHVHLERGGKTHPH
jgi:manganese transport system ATP-binding protein